MVPIKLVIAVPVIAVLAGANYAWHRYKRQRAAASDALQVDLPGVGEKKHLTTAITFATVVLWMLPLLLLPIHFKLGFPALAAGGVLGMAGLWVAAHLAEKRFSFGRLTLTREALRVDIPGEARRLPVDDQLCVRFWADHDFTGCDVFHPGGTLTLNYRSLITGKFPGVEDERPYRQGYGIDSAAGEVLFRRLAACARLVCFEDLERVPAPEADADSAAGLDPKLDWEPVSSFQQPATPSAADPSATCPPTPCTSAR